MSARNHPAARALVRAAERDAFASLLARHAPRGAVRAAEALAAMAMNRRRRRATVWHGIFAETPFALETAFAGLPEQPVSARADAAWAAICRRIAARALAGAAPDSARGGWMVVPLGAPAPEYAPRFTARVGAFAFWREG
jgi:hypothetical protein